MIIGPTLKRYATIKEKIKELEAELKTLAPEIIEEIKNEGEEEKFIEDPKLGKFTVCYKTTWKYTEKVKELQEKVDLAKDKEQKQGKAKAIESTYLLFTPKE